MHYSKPLLKLKLMAFGFIVILSTSCKNVRSDDQIKTSVIAAAKKDLTDSLKNGSPEAFSNFTVISEYDSVLLSIKYAAAQSKEIQINRDTLLRRKQMMDKLAPMYSMFNQTDHSRKQMDIAYYNINTALKNNSHALQLYSQAREICINRLKDKSLQNRIAGYKINCVYRESNSKVSIWELTLDTQFKVVSKSKL